MSINREETKEISEETAEVHEVEEEEVEDLMKTEETKLTKSLHLSQNTKKKNQGKRKMIQMLLNLQNLRQEISKEKK